MEEQPLKMKTEDLINKDLTTALLGAGIPLEKINHPSLQGLFKEGHTH